MTTINRIIKPIAGLLLSAFLFVLFSPSISSANSKNEKSRVIVSMGDSYSSGEGIEPFYGQYQDISKKVNDPNWLAHQSMEAWPGQLVLENVGIMKDHRSGDNPNWYFVASSGAKTTHLKNSQKKTVKRDGYNFTTKLAPQLSVFEYLDSINVIPDYVTITIGGNDAGFADILGTAAKTGYFFAPGKTIDSLNKVWADFDKPGGLREKLYNSYHAIDDATHNQSCIIVAGYPKLINPNGGGPFNEIETSVINASVTDFNLAINDIVAECYKEGMNIHFVPVEPAFDGHEAFTDDPYINNVILFSKDEDLKKSPPSAYSMHPNAEGARMYAMCVQNMIDHLEGNNEWYSNVSGIELVITEDTSESLVDTTEPSITETEPEETLPYLEPKRVTLPSRPITEEQARMAFNYYMADNILNDDIGVGYDAYWFYDDIYSNENICTFSYWRSSRRYVIYSMNLDTGLARSTTYASSSAGDLDTVGEYDFNAWDYLDNAPYGTNDNSKIDLSKYLDTNIFDAVNEIGDLEDEGTTSSYGYYNQYVTIESYDYSEYNNEDIAFIDLNAFEGPYSIFGVYPGMSKEEAITRISLVGMTYGSPRDEYTYILASDELDINIRLYFDEDDNLFSITLESGF